MGIKKVFMMIVSSMSMMAMAQEPLKSGIDLSDLNQTVQPGEDFYEYACGGWMKKNPLPAAYSRFGSFDRLAEDNNKRINGILKELLENTYPEGTVEQQLSDLYKLAMDSVRREKEGIAPAMPIIQKMEAAGYNPVPYYSKEMTVSMESLAEWNQAMLNSNGGIVFSNNHPIMNVPDINLRLGQYRFSFNLSIEQGLADMADLNDEDTCLLVRFTDNSGTRQLFEKSVNYGQFDSSGHLDLQVTSWFDAAGVEFNLIPEEGVALELHSVTYRNIA